MTRSFLSSVLNKIREFFSSVKFFKNLKKFFVRSKKNAATDYDVALVAGLSKKRWPSVSQFKYLQEVVTKREWQTLKVLFGILAVSVISLGVHGYFNLTHIAPASGGTYTEGLVGIPKLVNPLYAGLNDVDQDIASLVYSGLVQVDKQQQIVPDLAERWEVSEDQKEYTFYLREGATWHDGMPVTAGDVTFTIDAIQDPEFKSPLAANFSNVTLEVIDDSTIKFVLPESYSLFLENLTVGILPSHLWLEVVPANALLADYNLRPIGSGPYRFKSLTKDKLGNIKMYSLERYKDHLPKASNIEQIHFKFYPDFESAVTALKNHNIDGISYLPKGLQQELGTRKDIDMHSFSLPQYTGLFFNQQMNTNLKELKLRQALVYALDKDEIVNNALQGEGQVIHAPILEGYIGYHADIEKFEYDPVKAASLLEDLGWKVGVEEEQEGEEKQEKIDSDIRQKDGVPLKIILTTVNRAENFKAAQLIQKMWQAIGIKTEIRIVEATQIQSDVIRNRNFEVLLFGEIFGSDPDPYPFWHSSQAGENGLNLSNFINKDADAVLEEARQISDPMKRNDKYIHFQNILNQYLPAIFLYTPKYIYPVSNNVHGMDVQVISIPSDRFADIESWYMETRRQFK